MAEEPDNLVLQLLRGIRSEMSSMRAEMSTKEDLVEVRAEIRSLRADVASDLLTMQAKSDAEFKNVREQIVGVRRALIEYHSVVVGHGILISDLEARVRRVEQHLDLPPLDAR
jgi:hypothetical protein